MLQRLIRLFKRKVHPKANADGRYDQHPSYRVSGKDYQMPIRYAFTCVGVDYYCPVVIEDFGPRRMMEYNLRYIEYTMGVSHTFLKEYQDNMRAFLDPTDGKVQLSKAMHLNWDLGVRLEMVRPERMAYRYVSAYYFDLKEDLTCYDVNYNNEKIDFWQKHEKPAQFFFRKPVRELLGLQTKSVEELDRMLRDNRIQLALLNKQLAGLYATTLMTS